VLRADIGQGLRFVWDHRQVRVMTAISTLQCLAGGGFVGLMVVWCDRVLRVGTSGWRFGLVYGAWSVGGLIAAISLPRLLRRVSAAAIVLGALPFSAILGVATSCATSWELGGLGLLGWSAAYTLVVINSISYRQLVTPEPLLSRVSTAAGLLSWGIGWTGGALVSGVLGTVLGIRPAMIALTSVSVVAVALAWLSPLRASRRASAVDSRDLEASPAG
jgi:hypothetical protein